ncbi:MAG: helix-turn-helix transcriptional regulator [Clostridia bacterium]|nr:helix-turn-helix transcriptional regulator [Clostridia bacterium]
MTFPERLIFLRKSKNLTQKQVYTAIGMSPLGYQRYEYGEREPAFQKLIALADYFNVSLDYLVGRSDNPDSHK